MKTAVADITSHLNDDILMINAIEDIAINGIQVEGRNRFPLSIGTAVTSSLSVIERARSDHIDLLITHHGLLRKGISEPILGVFHKKLQLLMDGGITLLTYHLPLDIHPTLGNASLPPLDLGWKSIEPFFYIKNSGPIGVLASLPTPMKASHLKRLLDGYFQPPHGHAHAIVPEKMVSTIAFIPGQGHKYFQEAIAAGVDCFITGTSDEPVWHLAHEYNTSFLSFGHHATERQGVQKIGAYLAERYGLRHTFYDEANPF